MCLYDVDEAICCHQGKDCKCVVIAMVPSGVVDLDEDGRAGVVAIRRVALTCSMNRGDSVVQFRLFFFCTPILCILCVPNLIIFYKTHDSVSKIPVDFIQKRLVVSPLPKVLCEDARHGFRRG